MLLISWVLKYFGFSVVVPKPLKDILYRSAITIWCRIYIYNFKKIKFTVEASCTWSVGSLKWCFGVYFGGLWELHPPMTTYCSIQQCAFIPVTCVLWIPSTTSEKLGSSQNAAQANDWAVFHDLSAVLVSLSSMYSDICLSIYRRELVCCQLPVDKKHQQLASQLSLYLEEVISWWSISNINPLAVNIMAIHIPTSNWDPLFTKIGTFILFLHIWKRKKYNC